MEVDPSDPMERSLAWRRLASSLFGAAPDRPDELAGDAEIGADEPPRLGAYPLLGVLGRGAMGTVFLARDEALARDVAIKVVDLRPGDDVAKARARVIAEARALARVSHPAIVTVHSVFEEGGQVHIVMERIVGEPLRSWQARPLRRWREVLEVYLLIAGGLQAAHDRGVVHRDFKADNVLITPEGHPRVIDFGLSALTTSASGEPAIVGTPAFMAPEQAMGAAADPAMDLYSLCLALRDALRIYEGAKDREAAGAPIPAEVERVLARGLEPDPSRRWPSMRALILAIEGAVVTTPRERHRLLLLHRIESAWIDGVLARPGDDGALLSFGSALDWARSRARSQPSGAGPASMGGDGSLVILGAAGAGKTTALLELARDALAAARSDPESPAPVVLNLSSWTHHARRTRGLDLERWLLMALRDEYGIPERIARPWIAEDRLSLFLDGLDEVAPAALEACVRAIQAYRREHLAAVLLTCRADTYEALAAAGLPLGFGAEVELRPLDPDRVQVLLERSGPALAGLRAALAEDPALRSMLSGSPLLLDAAARAFADRRMPPLEASSAEALRATIWDAYIDRMIDRRPLDRPSRTAMLGGLGALARHLEEEALSELWVERIQPSWLGSGPLRVLYASLTLAVVWIGAAVIIALTLGPATTAAIVIPTASLAGAALTLSVATYLGLAEVRPMERLSWSWGAMLAGALLGAGRAALVGLSLGLVAALVWAVGEGPEVIVAVFIANFILYTGLFTLLFVVLAGLVGQSPVPQVMPNEGIRTAARNALRTALITAVVIATPLLLATWIVGAPSPPPGAWSAEDGAGASPGVLQAVSQWREDPLRFALGVQACIALSLGYVAGLLRGGLAVVQHCALRIALALAGELPLGLLALLESARERALVQRIGGGYRFVHGSLRRHLARRGPS